MDTYAIILAAGASSRLGQPKQLLHWRGQTLLAHAINQAQNVFKHNIIVVLGANPTAISAAIDLSTVVTVTNPDWQTGMASSIRAGIRALPDTATAAMLMLCDQALITAAHYQSLLNCWQQTPNHIAASGYQQSVGVPAVFPAHYFPQLLALTGDQGAKRLLQHPAHSVTVLPLPEAELDVDKPDDVTRLLML